MPRYAVYGIYKNEEKFIERFLNSVQAADEIVLCDTGTTDRTNEIIADFKRRHPETNLKTYPISVQPWRFDDAYNAALSLVGGDIDWCINMGMDETLMENWRSALDAAWDVRYTRCYHKFQTDWGNGAVSRHYHDRPHARRGYVWRLPVHEILEYSGEERVCWNHNFCIYHAPDTQKPRSAYLPLMEISVRERPDVWKTWGFLASEYMAAGRMDDATAAVERAMALPGSDKGYLYKLKFFICGRRHDRPRAAQYRQRNLLYARKARAIRGKSELIHALGRSAEAYLVLKQAARQTAENTDYHHNASCLRANRSAR
jgi:glycosyltransferase involved in cell wall biosynthesis